MKKAEGPVEPNGSPISMTARLMTAEQVAEVLNVAPTTVQHLHRVGLLRGILVGGKLRWDPRDLAAYIEALRAAAGRGGS